MGSVPDSTLSCAEAAALGWVHRISVCGVMWMMPFATTFLPLYSGSLPRVNAQPHDIGERKKNERGLETMP